MEEDTSNSMSDQLVDCPFLTKYSEAELNQLLICAAIELDSVKAFAQSQKQQQEAQIAHLEELLERVRRERDEIRDECIKLTNKVKYIKSRISDIEYNNNCVRTTPDHFYSGGSALNNNNNNFQGSSSNIHEILKPLPERGKLLEAVLQAGPLLQTLLVSGPLPQWRYPPPSFQSLQQISPILPENNLPTFFNDCYSCKNDGIQSPVFASPNSFVHGDQSLDVSNNNNVNAGFTANDTYSNEECHDSQTASTATKPGIGMIQPPNSNVGFGSFPIVWSQPFF